MRFSLPGLTGSHSGNLNFVPSTTSETRMTVRAATAELEGLRTQVHDRAVDFGAGTELVDDLLLVVSELATNVLMHTGDAHVEVGLGRHDNSWVIEVAGADGLHDANPTTPPGPDQTGGRGLFIVNAVMDEVALVAGPSGRSVRCVKHVAR